MKLNKELGQHFLTNVGVLEKIQSKIENFSKIYTTREVIEVGPGGGALTGTLLKNGYKVLAVEIDPRWCEHLTEKFGSQIEKGDLTLVESDVGELKLSELKKRLHNEHVILCGNLPYNRGQEIVLRFFEEAAFISAFVIMLQKEVADKFLPRSERKTYGPLSIKFNFLADHLNSFHVSPGSFIPPPKVESAVLSFCRKLGSEFDPIEFPKMYLKFSHFLKGAFAQRRKKLSNNIAKANQFPAGFEQYAGKRAEELSPDEHLQLWQAFSLKI